MTRTEALARQRTTFINQDETADILGVCPRTVRRMIADGRLTGYRIGRAIRLRLDEVEGALQPIRD